MKIKFLIGALLLSWSGASLAETFPIIDVREGYLIGAVSGGKWLESSAALKSVKPAKLPVYGVSGQVGTVGVLKVALDVQGACPEVPFVTLEPQRMERGLIAFSGNWNPLPRKPKSLDVTQKVYVDLVSEFLQKRGLDNPKVHITQIVRIDLEGDGEDEILISATHYQGGDEVPMESGKNTYSCVLLRRVVNGKVKTELVGGEFYPKARTDSAPPNRYELGALLDLNGDGKIDIVVCSAYYEGDEVNVYECGKAGLKKVLSIGCGA